MDCSPAEHGITGDVLVHLDHAALKDVGVHSVGQRLAILKTVYDLKVEQNIPIEEGHYVPPCEHGRRSGRAKCGGGGLTLRSPAPSYSGRALERLSPADATDRRLVGRTR